MGELQKKKQLVQEEMKKVGIDKMFNVIDKNEVVLFRGFQEIKDNKCLIGILLDESIYTNVTIFFGKLKDESERKIILELVNELNLAYKANEFLLNENNELLVKTPYIAMAKDFNAEVLILLVKELCQILIEKEYIKFEKMITSPIQENVTA